MGETRRLVDGAPAGCQCGELQLLWCTEEWENMTLSDRLEISEGSNARNLRWGVVRDLNLFVQDVSIRLDKCFEVELSPVGHFETADWCSSLVLGHGP